jgi:hypothetical protein
MNVECYVGQNFSASVSLPKVTYNLLFPQPTHFATACHKILHERG